MERVKLLKPFGAPQAPPERSAGGAPIFFLSTPKAAEAAAPGWAPPVPQIWGASIFFFVLSFTAAEGGGFPKVAPQAPLPRRAREIPPRVGILRVLDNIIDNI